MKVNPGLPLFLVFILISSALFSQEHPFQKGGTKVGIYFASFGDNPVFPFVPLAGAASYEGAAQSTPRYGRYAL